MDALVILVIIGWAVSALSKAAKRQNAGRRPGQPGPEGPEHPSQEGAREESRRPIRPVEVDLPGQTTMPIHWEGTVDQAWPQTLAEGEGTLHRDPPLLKPRVVANAVENPAKVERLSDARPATIPGLDLAFDGDSLVKGVIYAEILSRRPAGRRIR